MTDRELLAIFSVSAMAEKLTGKKLEIHAHERERLRSDSLAQWASPNTSAPSCCASDRPA
jgi:hypothetical protein